MMKTQSPGVERKAEDAGGCGRTSTVVYFCGQEGDQFSWYKLTVDDEHHTPEHLNRPLAFPTNLRDPEIAFADDRIYSIGGFERHSKNYSDKVFSFDTLKNCWKNCAALKQIPPLGGQYGHKAIGVEDKVYVFGSKIDLNYYHLSSDELDEIENIWAQVYYRAKDEWLPLKLKYYYNEQREKKREDHPKSLLGVFLKEYIQDGVVSEMKGGRVDYDDFILNCFPIEVDAYGDNKIRIHTHRGGYFILDTSENSLKKDIAVDVYHDSYQIDLEGNLFLSDGHNLYRSKNPFYYSLSDNFTGVQILPVAHTVNGLPERPQLHLLWCSPDPETKVTKQLYYRCIEYYKEKEFDEKHGTRLLKVNVKCTKSYPLSTTVFPIHGVVLPHVEGHRNYKNALLFQGHRNYKNAGV